MLTKMRPRYYCEHCKKGSGSPSAMRRHESACTLNPQRKCRMCELQGQMFGDDFNGPHPTSELRNVLDTDGFDSMRRLCNRCPACTLATLRTLWQLDPEVGYFVGGPADGRDAWSYEADKKRWWDEYREAQAVIRDRHTDAYALCA